MKVKIPFTKDELDLVHDALLLLEDTVSEKVRVEVIEIGKRVDKGREMLDGK